MEILRMISSQSSAAIFGVAKPSLLEAEYGDQVKHIPTKLSNSQRII